MNTRGPANTFFPFLKNVHSPALVHSWPERAVLPKWTEWNKRANNLSNVFAIQRKGQGGSKITEIIETLQVTV